MKVEDMSPIDRLKSVKGEAYQGNYLVSAKERNSEKKYRGQMSSSRARGTGGHYGVSSASKVDARCGSMLNFWFIVQRLAGILGTVYNTYISSNSKRTSQGAQLTLSVWMKYYIYSL